MLTTFHNLLICASVGLLLSCSQRNTGSDDAELKGILSEALGAQMEAQPSIRAAFVSIAPVSKPDEIQSIMLEQQEDDSLKASEDVAQDSPVIPGGMMQTATFTYYMDRGIITPDKILPTCHGILPEFEEDGPKDDHILDYEISTGKDSISIQEGFLKSYHYVVDRYVLDDLNTRGDNMSWTGFIKCLPDWFGPSDICTLPDGNQAREAASIADGSGLVLSQQQLLNFYGALATGGVHQAGKGHGEKRICSEETAKIMAALLRENVLKGTGIVLKDSPVAVSGKSGGGVLRPAEQLADEDRNGKTEKWSFSFIGFFPSDAPKYTMCVTMYFDNVPGYTLPGQAFKAIILAMNEKGML